jgi:hypothetical protein
MPFIKLSITGIIIWAVHFGLNSLFFKSVLELPLWKIHVMLFILSLVVMGTTVLVKRIKEEHAGFTYLACTIIKMALAVVFIYPIISNANERPIVFVLHFFAAYFTYLVIEVIMVVKLLKEKA